MFHLEEYEAIYNRIRYLIIQKSSITYILCHYFAEIKVDSYDSLPVKKLTLHNAIIHIKSVLNKDENHYYCKINIYIKKKYIKLYVLRLKIYRVSPCLLGGQLSLPNFEKGGSEKTSVLGDSKSSCYGYLPGGAYYISCQEKNLRAQFQMLILACYSQTINV